MITITNKHRDSTSAGIYVGRPSPLGNPYVMGTHGTRMEVIERYRHWLKKQLDNPQSKATKEFNRLCTLAEKRDLELICWCKPLPCHAEVIKEMIELFAIVEEEVT